MARYLGVVTFGLIAATSALSAMTGCGAGATGAAVRPGDKSASDALGESAALNCKQAPAKGEPLIVDWKTADQLDLTVAMQKGVALVSYDCSSIKVIKDCSVTGRYGFTAVPSVLQETVQISDADEAKASMPFGGAQVGGAIARGSSIDIGLAYVGKRTSFNPLVTKGDLTGGECASATHFVKAATVGAFAMETGTKGEMRAAADILGVGASASSSSSKKRLNSAGDMSACKGIRDGADKPPDSCSAVIRLELVAIASAPPTATDAPVGTPKPLENTCPEGFVWAAGRCAKATSPVAHRCDPTNFAECKDQCGKGDMESCYNAGVYMQEHAGATISSEAGLMLEKACNAGVPRACGRAALLYSHIIPPLTDKVDTFGSKGCALLDSASCFWVAQSDTNKPKNERFTYAKRACTLGSYDGCELAAKVELSGSDGIAKNTQDAVQLLDNTCTGGWIKGCIDLAELFDSDPKNKANMSMVKDVPADASKVDVYAQKACDLYKKKSPSGYKPSSIRGRACK